MTQPRRWFQLHLSTVVVVTLVAGGLIGLNLRSETETVMSDGEWNAVVQKWGWPASAFARVWREKEGVRVEMSGIQPWIDADWKGLMYTRIPCVCAVFDATVGLMILSAVGFTLEYLIRRRKSQK